MTPSNLSPDAGAGTPLTADSPTRRLTQLIKPQFDAQGLHPVDAALLAGIAAIAAVQAGWSDESRPAADPAGLDGDLAAVEKAFAIGQVSFDGDGWFAADAGYGYDEAEEAMNAGREAFRRIAARLSVADGPGPEETDPLFRAATVDEDADPPVAPPRPLAGSGHTDHPERSARDAVVDRRPASVAGGPGPEERPDLRAQLDSTRGALVTVAQWDSWASEWLAEHPRGADR